MRGSTSVKLSAARNEFESFQIVVEAPGRSVAIKEVRISALNGPAGAVIPASALSWSRVGYVRTTVVPPYKTTRGMGWYPDPLLPGGPFVVEEHSREPIWVTLKTPHDCPAGEYHGTVTIVPQVGRPFVVSLALTIWDFALTGETHLRTMTWLSEGNLRRFYGNDASPEGRERQAETVHRYEDFLLEHRLGPGGECVPNVTRGKDGGYDFRDVDTRLERLIGKGMNAFIMATAPNLRREHQSEYTPEFIRQFSDRVRAYAQHLREKGWLDRAYVYVYDEAPKPAWPEVKKLDRAIKQAAPGVRIFQCLNEPEGVRALTGFADVFDVYVAQYHKTGVAASQAKGAEAWLAICCYPSVHPNFFIEYPLVDIRATPWICWKYKAAGFEYWSPIAWGPNISPKGDKWPNGPWVCNTFGRYNGDGCLIYPGPGGTPYSSLRLETLRDGFEDYEYLWTLRDLLRKAHAAGKDRDFAKTQELLSLDGLVSDNGAFAPELDKYAAYREKIARAIVALEHRLAESR